MAECSSDVQINISESEVLSMIRDLKYHWYEIFYHLGFSYEQLKQCKEAHSLEPEKAMIEMISQWIKGNSLVPSWESLVSVLKYKLFENDIANRIEKAYCVLEDSATATNASEVKDSDEKQPGEIEDNNVQFSKFLMDVTEKLGPDAYVEMYQSLEEFKSPDGTRVLDDDSLQDRRSNDGLVIPLIYHSILNSRDVDFLIYMLRAVHRDDMLPMVQQYLLRINMGKPSTRQLHDPSRFICIRVILLDSVTEVDISFVSVLKKDLCVASGLLEMPYIIQFLWWKKYPICLFFQAPISCSNLIKYGLSKNLQAIQQTEVCKIVVEVHSVVFTYCKF